MVSQKDIFLKSEGNQWFERNFLYNKNEDQAYDQSLEVLYRTKKQFSKILEIGCSDGRRLWKLHKHYGAECFGVEPSRKAVEIGLKRYPTIKIKQGTADHLEFGDQIFDLVIAGFCLCLCDRKDLFKISAEIDRVLKIGGTLLVYDFDPPFPYRNKWHHVPGVYCYKIDYSSMFLWNPQYTMYERSVVNERKEIFIEGEYDYRKSVSLIFKGEEKVYPVSPYQMSK